MADSVTVVDVKSDEILSEDYSVRSTKIYCEDDYFMEKCSSNYHLKCDHTIQKVPEVPLLFDYFRFNKYLLLKSKIECHNRLVKASKGIIFGRLDYYTDERLKDEIFQVYGDLDESSERFQLLFLNYKEQRMEQIQEWTQIEEKVLTEVDDQGGEDSFQKQEFLNEEEYLSQHFTDKEIATFKAVQTGLSQGYDPFILPRKASPGTKTDKKAPGNKRSHKSKGYLAQRNELVAVEVTNVLRQHQTGLTRDKLLQICNERLSRKAPPGVFINLNEEMIDGYLTKEKVVVTKQFFQGGCLVFPHVKSSFPVASPSNPMDMLWDLRHKLLAILNLCLGIVEVNECIDLYRKIFKSAIFPSFNDWGFESNKDFVKWLFLEKWRSQGVDVIKLHHGKKGQSDRNYYLVVMTKKRRALLEKNYTTSNEPQTACVKSKSNKKSSHDFFQPNKGKAVGAVLERAAKGLNEDIATPAPSSSSPWNKQDPTVLSSSSAMLKPQPCKPAILNYDPTATFIDSKFVQLGQRIIREENEIEPRVEADCVVSLVNSPTNFYLVRTGKWRQLDRLFAELRDYWIAHPTALSPHPQFLRRNYLCLAKTDNAEELEVYRVVILGKPDPHHYQVFCIDYGDVLKVRHDQLRYLPRDLLFTLDAQAISCSLYNVASPTKDPTTGNDVWSKDVCDYTKKLFCPPSDDLPTVKVLFKQRMNGTNKWLVRVSTSKRLDFGEDVMKFVNK